MLRASYQQLAGAVIWQKILILEQITHTVPECAPQGHQARAIMAAGAGLNANMLGRELVIARETNSTQQ